jgi:hypothetical protein
LIKRELFSSVKKSKETFKASAIFFATSIDGAVLLVSYLEIIPSWRERN